MKHLFVPYELALKLKEKGFDEPSFAVIYPDGEVIEQLFGKLKLSSKEEFCVSAPLYQQVVDWFREKYGLWICVTPNGRDYSTYIIYTVSPKVTNPITGVLYETYYEALNKAIEEALKLIEL